MTNLENEKPTNEQKPDQIQEGNETVADADADEQLSGFGGDLEDEEAEDGVQDEAEQNADGEEDGTEEKADDKEEVVKAGADKEVESADEKSGDDQAGSNDKKALRAEVTKIAKARFKEETGHDYDAFDEDHQAILFDIVSEVRSEIRTKAEEIQKVEDSRKTAGASIKSILPTEEIQKFADEAFLDLPTRKSAKIQDDIANGDYSSMIEFCKTAAKEYESRQKAGKKVAQTKEKTKASPPPVLEGSGGRGEAAGASDDSMDQLAGFGLA